MKIHLSSTDVRALDGSVRTVAATIISDGGTAVSIPVTSSHDKLPNGTIVSTLSSRLIGAYDSSAELFDKFAKLALPASVNIFISF
jgi:ribosomal protein S10